LIQNQKIEGVISQIGDRSEKTTTITADIDGLNSKVSNITDLTKESTGIKTITLENCAKGSLLKLIIYGNNTVFKPFTLSDDLYLNNDLLLKDSKSILRVTDENGEYIDYDLKITDTLRQVNNIRDEFILDTGIAKIIRRINTNGTVKDNPTEENLGEINIILSQGNNTLSIEEYSAEMYAKYAIKSDLTDTFATKVDLNTSITQTSTAIMTEVNKKVDESEFGTKIEQNSEAVKLAWNQITEFIQLMIINQNASFAILDENQNILMALDKMGQHFFKTDGTIFGEMATNKEKDNTYISFAVNGEYDSDMANGMAWGIKTASDNKYYPILYIKNFHMGKKNTDDIYGQLSLAYCDLVLDGIETGIVSGNVKMFGNVFSGLTFTDMNSQTDLLSIFPINSGLSGVEGGGLSILNDITMFKNSLGSTSFKLGDNNKYVIMTDEGYLSVINGDCTFGVSDSRNSIYN
jgi:hypothetical protein